MPSRRSFLLLLASPLAAQEGGRQAERERALGQALAEEVRRTMGPVEGGAVAEYVRRIGARLAEALERPEFEYGFEVVQGRGSTDPVALPGGFVFVPLDLFRAAQDEGEFAGALAHAIAHVALERGKPKRQGGAPLVILGGWTGEHAETSGASARVPLGWVETQRRNELGADALGLELALRAGFEAAGWRRYVARRQAAEGEGSPLPARALRLRRLDAALGARAAVAGASSREYEQCRALAGGLAGRPEMERRPPSLRR